jgi:hypothetical protein
MMFVPNEQDRSDSAKKKGQEQKKACSGQSGVKPFHVFVLFRNDVIVNSKKWSGSEVSLMPDPLTD